jgi:hypothetical protein
MSRFRKFSKNAFIRLTFFTFLFIFLVGQPLPNAAGDRQTQKQAAADDALQGPSRAFEGNAAAPGSLEKVAPMPKKSRPLKTVWLIAALVVITGVVAYLVVSGAAKGSIDVQSSPAGAAILVDGSDTGETTPALLSKIGTGDHVLTLKKEGLQDFTLTVSVKRNQTTVVNAELMALAMSEDFQDNSADHWQNNGLGTWDIVNGVYRFIGSSTGSGNFAYCWYDLGSYDDFTCQARIRNGGDNGLAFRGNPASGEWYVFYAWGSEWAVFYYTPGSFDYLVHYTSSSALKSYPEMNEFKVVAKGSNFGFYINGILVGSASDTHLAKGKIGFQVRDSPGVTQEYDDVSVSLSTSAAIPAARAARIPVRPE